MNPILLDVIAAAVLLFFLWQGYKKGFVLTLCGFLAIFVALIGASFLSDVLAEPVAKVIEPAVTSQIHDTVTSHYQHAPEATSSQDEDDWLAQLPLEELLEPLRESKFFKNYVETFQHSMEDWTTEILSNAAQALAHFVAVQIARAVIFAIAFFAILIGWFFLSHTLDLVAKLPVLSTVNRWGGGAVGLCKGALIVLIAVWLLQDSYIPRAAVEQTFLLKFLSTLNPLSFFL